MSRWWHLDLMARYPELEIYTGGWGPDQELGLIELGDRVMAEEACWLATRTYSKERDRIWAAVAGMFAMVIQGMRDAGLDPATDPVPAGWYPDVDGWDEGRRP
jgi:hypothetical protein